MPAIRVGRQHVSLFHHMGFIFTLMIENLRSPTVAIGTAQNDTRACVHAGAVSRRMARLATCTFFLGRSNRLGFWCVGRDIIVTLDISTRAARPERQGREAD